MISVLRWVENSNAAGRTVPVSFVVLLANDGDRQLWLPVEEERRGLVPSVQSMPLVSVSPLDARYICSIYELKRFEKLKNENECFGLIILSKRMT